MEGEKEEEEEEVEKVKEDRGKAYQSHDTLNTPDIDKPPKGMDGWMDSACTKHNNATECACKVL